MRFFHSKVQVVDSFIVAISLALDIAVVVIQNVDSTVANGLGLIIILRLWRVVRIVNGRFLYLSDIVYYGYSSFTPHLML